MSTLQELPAAHRRGRLVVAIVLVLAAVLAAFQLPPASRLNLALAGSLSSPAQEPNDWSQGRDRAAYGQVPDKRHDGLLSGIDAAGRRAIGARRDDRKPGASIEATRNKGREHGLKS